MAGRLVFIDDGRAGQGIRVKCEVVGDVRDAFLSKNVGHSFEITGLEGRITRTDEMQATIQDPAINPALGE